MKLDDPQFIFSGDVDLQWRGAQPEDPKAIGGSLSGQLSSSILGDYPSAQVTATKTLDSAVLNLESTLEKENSSLRLRGVLDWPKWSEVGYDASVDASQATVLLDQLLEPDALPDQLGRRVVLTGAARIVGRYPDDPVTASDFSLEYLLGRYKNSPLGLYQVKGALNPERVLIDHAQVFLNSRTADVSGEYRLNGEGLHRGKVAFQAWPLSEVVELAGGPLPLQGVDGLISADLAFEAEANRSFGEWKANGTAGVKALAVGDTRVGDVQANVESDQQRVRLKLNGTLFGGSMDGILQYRNQRDEIHYPLLGTLDIQEVALSQLIGLWQDGNKAASFGGIAGGHVEFGIDPQENLQGNVVLDLNQVRYQSLLLTDRVTLRSSFNNQRAVIEDFELPFGGGAIRGSGELVIDPSLSARTNVDLRNVDLSKVIAFVDADLAESYQGIISGRVTPTMNSSTVEFRGSIQGRSLNILSIPIQDARSTVSTRVVLANGSSRTKFANVRGTSLGGRLSGQFELNTGRGLSFDTDLSIDDGDLQQLSQWSGTGDYFGKGLFDASVNLGAKNYLSLRDLNGNVAMEFGQTDAQSVPLINPISRAVPAVGLPRATFDEGSLDAIVNNGQLRIQRSLLYNPTLWMSAAGVIGLANNRLDLEVTVFTGSTGDSPLIEAAIRNLIAIPDPTIQTISAFAQAISNRTVYLNVGGTANSPIVRVQAARTVGRYVAESFVRQFARGAILPAAASVSNQQ